ncbi:type II secretion system F family protein [Paenibacillus campi]|uniref:type II secretion system F family protein n=1 Tax=Paenibacillus campi TaxID=3106031 RepID=UPI002AFE1464|nr:type II secretion system F family protein [Paenibacillus sp. SGZ-1014]
MNSDLRSSIAKQQTVQSVTTHHLSEQQDKYNDVHQQTASSTGLADYTTYELRIAQRVGCMVMCGAVFAVIGYLFYHHWIMSIVLACLTSFTPRLLRNYLLERRRSALSAHFKQALYSLSSSLAAGRSVENGFREAAQDLRILYPDGDNDMIRELTIITTRMDYGQPIEQALEDFSVRAANEDIANFADVFITCKRTGGDLVEVVRKTSTIIGEKLDIQQDIAVMIAQKKFESYLLMATPFVFLIFLNMVAGDFMKPLYGNPLGIVVSTLCLLALTGCFWMIRKFINIRV